MKPLISVIVPIYNVEAYLSRCIESIIFQTYSNLEIILVDDGSPDNCGKICDEYAKKDNRICVIHKKNGGHSSARNEGISVFKGAYVMFVDSDDYLSVDCVELLYSRLVIDNSDIAVGNYVKVFENDAIRDGYKKCPNDCVISRDYVLDSFHPHLIFVSSWGKLYKREIIKNIAYPSLICGEDSWVFGEIIDQCDRISFINKALYYYYQRSNSIVHSPNERTILDSISADLHIVEYLVKEGRVKNASLLYALCIDRALSVNKIANRLKYFRTYFDKKTCKILLKETDFETKIKWYGLHLPCSNKIRKFIVNIKNKFKR